MTSEWLMVSYGTCYFIERIEHRLRSSNFDIIPNKKNELCHEKIEVIAIFQRVNVGLIKLVIDHDLS